MPNQLTYFQWIAAPHTAAPKLFQLALFHSREVDRLLSLLRHMLPGDALRFDRWRLEQAQLNRGLEHYRLYNRGHLIGIKDIRSEKVMGDVQVDMARFLALIGFVAERTVLIEEGARTPRNVSLDTAKNRAGQLWIKTYSGKARRKPEPFSISALLN